MQDVITIGRRLVPLEQIVLVEPFDPESNPEFKPEKPFKARLVLVSRDNILAEFTPQEFAATYGFRMLPDDGMAANPAVAFRVETFAPSGSFTPTKPYTTRLKWRDGDGNEHSRLLLTKPEAVIALALRGETNAANGRGMGRRPRARGARRGARKPELVRS
jgi:hypothetical protein